MLVNTIIHGFNWDTYNKYKNIRKHGILNQKTESAFTDKDKILFKDEVHSNNEDRFIIIGTDFENTILFIVFTIRNQEIRPISSRPASRKERRMYEEKQKRS